MVGQRSFIFWGILSLGLHIALLAWCPPPTFTIPPLPVYLVVDLFSGPALSGTGNGSISSGMEDKTPGMPAAQTQAPLQTRPEQPPQPAVRQKPARTDKSPAPVLPVKKPPPVEPVPEDYPVTSVEASPLEPNGAETEFSPIGTDASMDSGTDGFPTGPPVDGIAGGRPGAVTGSGGGGAAGTGTGGSFGSGDPASGSPVATPLAYGTNPPPPYPVTARRRGWEGKVLLQVEVSAGGDVRNVEIEKSSGYTCLDDAARQAVYRWRFRPALQNGRPVPGRVKVPIHFNLKIAD
jgi:protein TonB